MRHAGKIGLLLALYFVQGLPFGFQAIALPVYLREEGVSLTGIGFVGLLALPWVLKIFWAPLVDRYHLPALGRRKSWIVPAQAGLAACAFIAAGVDAEQHLQLVLALVFAMNFFAATQDIAVDGWAVSLLGEDELGPGNAAQVVGYKIGMLTGGGLLVWLSQRVGWTGLFLAMGVLVSAVLAGVILVRERDDGAALEAGESEPESLGLILRTLFRSLRIPGMGWVLLAVATYKLGESMIDAMFKPFLVDVGFERGDIGLWMGTWGMGASLAGSLAGGWLARALPLWRALFLAAALRALPLVGEWWLSLTVPSDTDVIAITLAEHVFGGALTTCMFAFMMSRVDKSIGATHYTLLASIEVLGKSPGSWLSGVLADAAGYSVTFGVGVLVSLGFLGVLWPLRRHVRREVT